MRATSSGSTSRPAAPGWQRAWQPMLDAVGTEFGDGVLREGPDTVELGANVLVDDDPEQLAAAVAAARMPDERPPLYGDGHAAERVAASLADRG